MPAAWRTGAGWPPGGNRLHGGHETPQGVSSAPQGQGVSDRERAPQGAPDPEPAPQGVPAQAWQSALQRVASAGAPGRPGRGAGGGGGGGPPGPPPRGWGGEMAWVGGERRRAPRAGGDSPENPAAGPGRAWIFTSATLGEDEQLSWFTQRAGLQDAEILRVASPFD